MLYLPQTVSSKILDWNEKNIDEDWLTGDGRESDPHITVKYGLFTKDREDVEPLFPSQAIEATLGKVSRFDTAKEHDVLKIDIESEALNELHEAFGELPNDDEHPTYQAHATLAYVKKGEGKNLDGAKPFDGMKLLLSHLVWSPAGDGEEKQHISLPTGRSSLARSLICFDRLREAWLRQIRPGPLELEPPQE